LSSLIELINLTKIYKTGLSHLVALDHINLKIMEKELVAIMGASGSGKSTAMNIIGLLDRPTDGVYKLCDKDVSHLKDDERALIRNQKIGFVFQSFFLLPRLNIAENVALPLFYRGIHPQEAKEKALAMLDKVGIKNLWHHKPSEMSGGQQQRVAIARALIGDPAVILADEPTGALDSRTSQDVMNLFIHLNREEDRTIIIVTHDPAVGKQCDRTVELHDGYIVADNLTNIEGEK